MHNPLKQLKLRRPIVAKAVDCRVVVNRFIEHPPQSRNEDMGAMLRRVVVCARRGSGWDKVTFVVEANQLLTPLIQATKNHTRGALFGHKELSVMTKEVQAKAISTFAGGVCNVQEYDQHKRSCSLRHSCAQESAPVRSPLSSANNMI